MREAMVFEASRDGYGIDQIADKAMTIGMLRNILDGCEDDMLFILSHDNGYTFGSLDKWDCYEAREDEDGEWERY